MGSGVVQPGPDPPVRGELVHRSEHTRVTRLLSPEGTVIRKEPLGPDAQSRVWREVAILERLRGVGGVVQLAEGPQDQGSVVLADAGRVSLAGKAKPLAAGELTALAAGLARAVAEMHRRGIMHRDINPANIVLDRDGAPCLVDFALATPVAEIRVDFTHHARIAGTLAYLAPEATGRTGRLIDQRADLYALGATLYELATGAPPFGSGDLLRLIHDHLARLPVPPAQVNPAVPEPLSQIILRLLEKEPDSRYQTADGLTYDLERAQGARAGPKTAGLRVGEHDVPARLLQPSRLVGRDDEIAALEAAFEGALRGRCQGVLIAGAPGVGKTSLADQLRPVVTGLDGWFAAGKFDQYRRDLEFDAANQALRALGRLLLAEPDAEVTRVREQIVQAVGPNVGLLAALVPEFATLLAVSPDPGDPLTAQTRAQRAAAAALRAVASPARPLVMALDDLQWAGRAAFGLVDLMLGEDPVEGLLLVAAYREDDVDVEHPLAAPLSRWLDQATVLQLRLVNLPGPSLVTLIAEMLHADPATAAGLAEVIAGHTRGNPFETLELLSVLRRDHLLTWASDGWRWDDAAVRAHVGRSDVAELLAARPAAMTEQSRALLEQMACLGGRAEIGVLQVAVGVPEDMVEQRLAPALDEGLLVMESGAHPAVRFRHDRTREAILGGLDPQQQQALQLAMARRLAAVPQLFAAAAEQYLPVARAVDDAGERRQVVGLLRRAAERAGLIGDYALVNALLEAALPLIDPGEAGTLTEVHAARHAALYGLGRLEEADEEYQTIEDLCPTIVRRASAAAVQVLSLTHRTRFADAIGLGIRSLRELGIVVPPADRLPADLDRQFGYLYRWLDDSDEAGELARPDITNPTLIAAAGLINALLPANYVTDHGTLAWLSLEGLRIWLEHGPSSALAGPVGHTAFVAVTLRGDYDAGNRAVRRILALGETRGYEPGTSQARFLHAVLACWTGTLEDGIEASQRAREGLVAGGDLAYAGYTYLPTVYYQLDSAPSAAVCAAEAEAGLAFARRTGNEEASGWLDCCRWLTDALRGERQAAEPAPLSRYESNPLALFHGHVTAAVWAAIFDDPASLVQRTEAVMTLLPVAMGLYTTALARLLRCLALASQASSAKGDDERGRLLAELDEATGWLAARAADAPDNFRHLLRLAEAERAWAIGDFRTADLAYDAARREASLRQRPWHQALITERAARFYLTRGLDYAGYDLLAQARQQYLAWGATAKVEQLDWAYPALQAPAEVTDGDGTLPRDRTVVMAGTIDLLGIVSASQALSSETSVGRLHARVAKVLSAMTGATGVQLVLWNENPDGWQLSAPDGGTIPVGPHGHDRVVPMSVLRYAQRTREPLVVADAARDDRFARDRYFAGVDCCSLLAVPILSRGMLRAVLLLENRLLGGAFTASRLDAVKLVAGQLAVSLDNARTYAGFRQIADEQAALQRVATLVAQVAPPESVFAAVTAEAGELLGVDVAVLVRYDPPDAITVAGAWTSTGAPAPTPVGSQLPLGGHNATTLVFRTGQTARTDYAEVPGVIGNVATRDWGLRSSVGVPIRVEGRLWGAMVVALTSVELLPADAEVRLAGFTELVATAIAGAQARAELQNFGEEQAALRRVATLVARAAPPEEVFTAVTAEVRRVLGDFDTNMWRYDADGAATLLAVLRGDDTDPSFGVSTRVSLGGRNVTTLVFQTQRPVRIDDYSGASGSVADLVRDWEQRLGPRTRSAVGVPVSVAGRLWGAMIVTSAQEPLPADAEVRLAGFTELVATAIASAQARAELQSFGEEQAALRRVATLVARAAPPEEVLAAVTAEAGRLLSTAATILCRYDPEGTETVVGVWSAAETLPVTVGTRTRLGGRNVSTLVFQTGRPARIDDYSDVSGPAGTQAHAVSVRAAVGVPISVEGRLWGVVIVASAREPLPTGIEARLAGFTELVATAIANTEARAALAASRARIVTTADATRRRIERDLHDGAQQRLVSLTLWLRAAQAALPGELGAELDHAVTEAAGALEELREIARGLHPPILAERGLPPALKTLARRSPIPVDLRVLVDERLPEPVEVSAYYVIAEALTNAVKHARASAVGVEVDVADGTLHVAVRDDGAGGADVTRGTGLAGLKDRVEALGGRILIDSPRGAGTSVEVNLPLTASDDGAAG